MIRIIFGAAAAIAIAAPAAAQTLEEPPKANAVQVKPILEARLRYETVDQGALDAEALTLRFRAGVEASSGPFARE
jgi:hypothetical protein